MYQFIVDDTIRTNVFYTMCSIKNIRFIFSSFLTQMLADFNNYFTAAFSDKLQKTCNKIYHLTSNLLPHYLVKTECSTVQLYSTLFNASVMQNSQFTESV